MAGRKKSGIILFILLSFAIRAGAQSDTLRLLSYNVLYIGDTPPCQGPHNIYEGYIETVLSYANADIIGFVKMEAQDNNGTAPAHFNDSLLQYSFNAAYPGRYAYCLSTNVSGGNNITALFYDQQKLGFAGILCTYANITDFTTYKLYYKSADLTTTHDTIFLYITLNHTNSGSGSSNAITRGQQVTGEMAQIETHFTTLPNMINMGDFNVHNSAEACYQTLVAPANLNYRYYDPPFYPDALYTYPADWDNNPGTYATHLSVSTRETTALNTCTTDVDGGKSWYDHIFLSASIINNNDHIGYLPNSFKVIGNDGNRLGVSVNSSPANASAPSAVLNSIYAISQHYPVTLSLTVNTTANFVATVKGDQGKVTVINPVDDKLKVRFSEELVDKTINVVCTDVLGRVQMKDFIVNTNGAAELPCSLHPGVYYLRFVTDGQVVGMISIFKK